MLGANEVCAEAESWPERERLSDAPTSTWGRYSLCALPRSASAARAWSQAVRVSGLFERARSITWASEIGMPGVKFAGRTSSRFASLRGGTAFAGGVHELAGASDVPG